MASNVSGGVLYENGQAKTVKVTTGTNIKVQAKGEGTFQLVGQLVNTDNENWKVLMLVDLSDFSTVATVDSENIYAGDVGGLYSVTVENVNGFEKIWCAITD